MNSLARFASLLLAMAPALVVAQTQPTPADPSPRPYWGTPPRDRSPSQGAEGVGSAYLAARAGVVVPQHDDLQGFENGFSIEGAVGYLFSPNFALELSLGRWEMSGSGSAYDPTIGPLNAKLEFVGYPLLATAKVILPIDRVQLHVLAGGGVHFISARGEVSAPALGLSRQTTDSTSPFAIHLGGGLAFQVSPRAVIGAELRYVIGEMTVLDATGHFDHLVISGSVRLAL
jgi:opacity protein-like surface antigen